MYCSNCGQYVARGRFCSHCGSMVTDRPANENESGTEDVDRYQSAKKQINMRRLVVSITVVVVLVALIVMERTSYQRVVHDYFKAYEQENLDRLLSARTEFEMEYYEDRYGKSEYRERCQSKLEDQLERWEDCGINAKINYDIQRAVKATASELRDLEDYLGEKYDCKYLSITDAYALDIKFRVIGSGGQQTFKGDILMVKENGKWGVVTGYVDVEFFEGNSTIFERI